MTGTATTSQISGFSEIALEAAQPVCPRNRQLLDYWIGLAADCGGIPAKRDFDPARVPNLLAQMMVFEAGEGGAFTVRLAGTVVEAMAGRDLSGLLLEQVLTGEPLARTRVFFAEILARPCAYLIENTYRVGHATLPLEQLQLPFADTDGAPRFVFNTLIERVPRMPRFVDLAGAIPEIVPGRAIRLRF